MHESKDGVTSRLPLAASVAGTACYVSEDTCISLCYKFERAMINFATRILSKIGTRNANPISILHSTCHNNWAG